MLIGLLLYGLAQAPGEHIESSPRAVWIEIYQSGAIRVAGKTVRLSRLSDRIRAIRPQTDILCVWHQPKTLNGRPAFDPHDEEDMQRFAREMQTVRILAEVSRDTPSFNDRDAICATSRAPSSSHSKR